MVQKGITLEIPGGSITKEKDWYPFVMPFNDSAGFRRFKWQPSVCLHLWRGSPLPHQRPCSSRRRSEWNAIGQAIPALEPHIHHYDFIVSDEGRGNYFTPSDALKDVPKGKKTTILILQGHFKKPVVPHGKKVEWKFFNGLKWTE